jgi:hypothetical protein
MITHNKELYKKRRSKQAKREVVYLYRMRSSSQSSSRISGRGEEGHDDRERIVLRGGLRMKRALQHGRRRGREGSSGDDDTRTPTPLKPRQGGCGHRHPAGDVPGGQKRRRLLLSTALY